MSESIHIEIQGMSKNIQNLDVTIGKLGEEVKGMKEAILKQNGRVSKLEDESRTNLQLSARMETEMKHQTMDLKEHEGRDEKVMDGVKGEISSVRKEIKDLRKTMYVGSSPLSCI